MALELELIIVAEEIGDRERELRQQNTKDIIIVSKVSQVNCRRLNQVRIIDAQLD